MLIPKPLSSPLKVIRSWAWCDPALIPPRFVQSRGAKILRWIPDTPHAHAMGKLTHFEDLLNYCLDNKDTLGKRDVIASLSLMRTLKNFSLSSPNFIKYADHVLENLGAFDTNLHLLVHRFAILGYNPALVRIYEGFLKNSLGTLNAKSLCLIAWSYAKNNVFIEELFHAIGATALNRVSELNLTDMAMLLWSFAKIDRMVPEELGSLRREFWAVIKSIRSSLGSEGEVEERARPYVDERGAFHTNVVHDICMGVRSLSLLVPRDVSSITKILHALFDITDRAKLPISSQGITSLWETLRNSNIRSGEILERLCEASRHLRLDHSFNSNMVSSIVTALHSLEVRDPRIVYQVVHWLEKRSVQMQPQQMYNVICLLDRMKVYHARAWKQLGVAVQKKAIDLELHEIRNLYNIFKRNGKGNDRIYGVLDQFMSCKQDIEQYGFT